MDLIGRASSMEIQQKHIPQLRFPDFFNNGEWKDYSIEEVFDIRNGYTPSKSKTEYWENGTIPWFRMEDIRANGNILSDSIQHITPEAIKGFALFPAYSIIVATSATIGEHALITVESLANQRFTYLSKKKPFENKVDMLYFHYYMFVIDEWCKKNTNTGGFLSVNMSAFRQLRIPLSTLAEQRRIAACLSALDEMLAATNARLGQLKAYKKGLMQKLFPAKGKKLPELRFKEFEKDGEWVEKKYEDCLEHEQPQSYLVSSENYKKTGIPVLTAGKTFILGFTDETFGVYTKLPVIIFDDFTTDSRFVDFPFKAKSSAMKMLSVKEGYDLRFVFATMQNNEFKPHDHQRHWISIYSKFKVEIPSLAEQRKIANCITSIDEVINQYTNKVRFLELYKKGLMQQLFPTSI